MGNEKCKEHNKKCTMKYAQCKIQKYNSKYYMPNVLCIMHDAQYTMCNAQCTIQITKCILNAQWPIHNAKKSNA